MTRKYTTTNATRLLCAGAYLDEKFRATVIEELTKPHRTVAPAYGYDVVAVLAHALAARRLKRQRIWSTLAGIAVIGAMTYLHIFHIFGACAVLLWLVWAFTFLQRLAVMEALITRLKSPAADGWGFSGGHPKVRPLTPQLMEKLAHEQESRAGVVHSNVFSPFVGAGKKVHDWSTVELLLEAGSADAGEEGATVAAATLAGLTDHLPKPFIPFTADELTAYVQERLLADLRDEARPGEAIGSLIAERRWFTAAAAVGRPVPRPRAAESGRHEYEGYGTPREYLCVRVGSWGEEVVTAMFVRFEVIGGALCSEFNTFVLRPIDERFHRVDRMPVSLTAGLIGRIAWDVVRDGWSTVARGITATTQARQSGTESRSAPPEKSRSADSGNRPEPAPTADTSGFGVTRYVTVAPAQGAAQSIREEVAIDKYHHFFQNADAVKYRKIVERRLLAIVAAFLRNHNVDLGEHNRQTMNILNNPNFGLSTEGGSVNISGEYTAVGMNAMNQTGAAAI